jgi:uncharacterized repeat protein (TIGR04138 family)
MLDPSRSIARLLHEDKRYRFDAYVFVFEALSFAQEELNLGTETPSEPGAAPAVEEEDAEAVERHVTGQELCEAIRQFALKQYGYMAKAVLNSWGIQKTGDFGEIVFNLIRIGQMRKTKHDRREDFDDVYDFDAAFVEEFKFTPSE